MQINNNPSVQNFGMALRIDKAAKELLKEQAPEVINELVKVGRDLADTKLYHVEVGADLVPRLVSDKDAYFGVCNLGQGFPKLVRGQEDNIIIIDNVYGVAKYVPYEAKGATSYNTWLGHYSLGSLRDAQHIGAIAKNLDKVAVEKYAQDLAKAEVEAAKRAEVSKAVDSLLDEFGV